MFELASPWILMLWPLPLLLWFGLKPVFVPSHSAMRIPFLNALNHIMQQNQYRASIQTNLLAWLFVWSLLLLALANPCWIGEPTPLARRGHNIMLTLDLSPSMAVNDMRLQGRYVTRLDVVKRAASDFVQRQNYDKIGLILFGERAYLQTPFTYDHINIQERITDATPGLAGKTTAIGDAVGLAIKRLNDVAQQGRVIILLTDGANNSGMLTPLKAAELAKLSGIKIYTIGLASDPHQQNFNDLFLKVNATDDLDEETLKKMAKMTDGQYFRATDLPSLNAIYDAILQMEAIEQDQALVRPKYDYYAWPLGLALVFLLFFLTPKQAFRLPITSKKFIDGQTS